jgi:indolepyruvate ferredoxin oxidoreductase alpha subunit
MFAFVGDSTFFASGITGVVNAVYNQSEMILIVVDNATTAMTGNQPHPGTGRRMTGSPVNPISIPKVLEAVGVSPVIEADPLDHKAAIAAVKRAIEASGVRAVIFKSPCVANLKKTKVCRIDTAKCTSCKTCVKLLGCPALVVEKSKIFIEPSLCTGCNLCAQICPQKAIGEVTGHA